MFKIGDFSKLSQVTVKTLRYYDQIGLFEPAHVDTFTGYRYYSVDQLPRLNRLLALRDLGFSLEQIGDLLNEDLPADRIRGMFQMKQAEIEQHLEAESARLARVEARLRQIEQEGRMSGYDVVLKKVEPLKVAAVREVIPSFDHIGRLMHMVFAYVGQHGGQPAGPPLALYYDMEYRDQQVDVEIAIPVGGSLPDAGPIVVRELPGTETMASLVHKGSYEGIGQAYTSLMAWIEANGYRIAGPNREIYLRGGQDVDPADYVTEVQMPVEKA